VPRPEHFSPRGPVRAARPRPLERARSCCCTPTARRVPFSSTPTTSSRSWRSATTWRCRNSSWWSSIRCSAIPRSCAIPSTPPTPSSPSRATAGTPDGRSWGSIPTTWGCTTSCGRSRDGRPLREAAHLRCAARALAPAAGHQGIRHGQRCGLRGLRLRARVEPPRAARRPILIPFTLYPLPLPPVAPALVPKSRARGRRDVKSRPTGLARVDNSPLTIVRYSRIIIRL
jgi:hypothetical protein